MLWVSYHSAMSSTGGQYVPFKVGGRGHSKKYDISSITLLAPGQKRAMGPGLQSKLYKHKGTDVSFGLGDMATNLKGLYLQKKGAKAPKKRAKSRGTKEERIYGVLKNIVDTGTMAKVGGRSVDTWTASVIVQVADALSPANRKKFLSMDFPKMHGVALRLLKTEGMTEAMASGVTNYDVPPPGMMGRYMPPMPGQLGPKPKQRRRARLRKKWAKMPIEIAFGPKGLNVKTIEAWVKGVWAVHRNPQGPGWRLSHVPTGMAAFPNIDSEKSGKAIIDEFLARMPSAFKMGRDKGPDDAREVAAEYRSRYIDVLKDVVRELRDPAFLEKFPPGIGKKHKGMDRGAPFHTPDDTYYSKVTVF
jgi:hypothetical protein